MAKSSAGKSESAATRKRAAPRKRTTTRTAADSKRENAVTQEQIALRAHELSAAAGHPEGRDVEFWLEAERQLLAERTR